MATFILVHGSWHGGWCWESITPFLEKAVHNVVAVDLPGRGDNPAALNEQTMENGVKLLVNIVNESEAPVYLVGHSAGGVVVSQAAEEVYDKIAGLIYIAAFMVPNGATVLDIANADAGNEILPCCTFAEDGSTMTVNAGDATRAALYADCSDEDVAKAFDNLVVEASQSAAVPLSLSDHRYGRIPRTYIRTLQDRAVSIAVQDKMIAAQPSTRVLTIDSSHSPFISKPEELATLLIQCVT